MAALRKGISPAILLFAACTLWGVATVLNKSLLVTFAPVPLLLIELVASAFALWVACLALARPLPRGKTLLVAVALGVLNPGIAYTFSLLGLSRISASVTSLLWATEPFLITFLAAVVLREKVTRPVIAVIGLGFAGVVLVSGLLSASGLGQTDMVGTIYLFLAVLICAFYTVLSRWLGGSVDALALVTVQQTAGLGWDDPSRVSPERAQG